MYADYTLIIDEDEEPVIMKKFRKGIEVFESWMSVSWVEHRTNASVLQELKNKGLLNQIKHTSATLAM